MEEYINGAILESIEKGKTLKTKIPRAKDLGFFFPPLVTTANNEIDKIIGELEFLLEDSSYYSISENLRQKFSAFKQLSGQLSEIENIVVAAISRKSQDDDSITKLVYDICYEINYPLSPPIASCLSQNYYQIYPHYNLICIPLLESDFLLHIPDIYHELGHPLLSIDNNPLLKGFKDSLGRFNLEVIHHFDTEIKRRALNKVNADYFDSLSIWKESWIESWSVEFFCDLFAVFTLGPAYAWSYIHMCAKMSWNIYNLSPFQKTEHPPNDARMSVIFNGLSLLGFHQDVEVIKHNWEEFKRIISVKPPEDEYTIAFPSKLLQSIAQHCLQGTKALKITLAAKGVEGSKIYRTLSEGWKTYWENPEEFHLWEREQMSQLKAN